jgi:hypothetical protein
MITNLDIDSILNRGEPRDYRSSQRDCCVTERDWSYYKRARSFRLLLSRGLNNKMVFVGSLSMGGLTTADYY